MNHSVTFILEKRNDKDGNLIVKNIPLFADIKFSGKRLNYYTGYRIDASNFNLNSQRVEKNTFGKKGANVANAKSINNTLVDIESTLNKLFVGTDEPQKHDITKTLDNVIGKHSKKSDHIHGTNFVEWFNKYIIDGKQSDVRKRNIKSILDHWITFESKQKRKIDLMEFNLELLKKFEKFLIKPLLNEKGEVERIALSRNTISKAMVITRAFLNFVRETNIEIPYPFGKETGKYKVQKEVYGDPIYLTIDERNTLESFELNNERLQRVRDVFIFQALVGCRYGDLQKFTRANITGGQLVYIAGKTKEGNPKTIKVPLGEKAKTILDRYSDLPAQLILPPYSEQVQNRYLKELFKICDLTRNVSRLNPNTREPEQVRICDIASTHMARRTFVGALFGKNYDRDVIGSMSGHSANSKALSRYYSVVDEHKQRAINDIE